MAFWEKIVFIWVGCCTLAVLPVGVPLWAKDLTDAEMAKLSRTIQANTKRLTVLEKKLATQSATLAKLEAELAKLQAHKTRKQAHLQEQTSAFHVHMRDTARMAAYPWQAQMVEDVLNGRPARPPVVRQIHAQQAAVQHGNRAAIQATLTQQLSLQSRYAQEAETTNRLLAQRTRLQHTQWRLLGDMKVADSQLAKRLQRALPSSHKVAVQAISRTALYPTQPHAPVQGLVVEETQHDGTTGLTIQATSGAAVNAFQAGKIIYSGTYRGFGQVLIVETAPHKHDVYAGLGHKSVRIGDAITQGQVLGSLPNVVAPRLYFERRG